MRLLAVSISVAVLVCAGSAHAGRSQAPDVFAPPPATKSTSLADPPVTVSPTAQGASTPSQRAQVAARWAPTLYQETRDAADFLTAFDFDGDWDGSNNALHIRQFPLKATVYYTADETPTHWLVTYVIYHPVDGKVPGGHDHDTEHVTLVVRRDGGPLGRIDAMETRFHKWLYQYAAAGAGITDGADDVDGPIHFAADGRPQVYIQRVGHGICGGYSPPTWFNALALECKHKEEPHIERHGVVYHYSGVPTEPRSIDDRDVGYGLAEIGDTLWAHVHESGTHATYASLFDFQGERCGLFRCPRGIGGPLAAAEGHGSTGMPWEEGGGRGVRSRGDAFLDPAWTLSRRLTFPAPFSTTYLFNPYLGVGEFGRAATAASAAR